MPEPSRRAPARFPEQIHILLELARWLPISAVVGLLAGSASALLLSALAWVTAVRERHVALVLLLAPAGWAIGLLYQYFGARVEGGNNLILEQVHDPSATIPVRMTPLVLIGTVVTHLFGGSAGREGTAVQMGASLADQLAGPLRMGSRDRRILIMAGVSAGFASVFGTPLAGAIFGLEVLAVGRLSYEAIAPCVLAAFAGDLVARALGAHHTVYSVTQIPTMTLSGVLYSILTGVACGLVAMAFAKLTHAVSHTARHFISRPSLRPVAGGLLVTTAVFAIGPAHTLRFLGLGIPTIVASFSTRIAPFDFAVKTIFTAVTLGTGFKGGEVTPLFYIGSTLGNSLSHILPLPPSLLAAMGFVAVFAGAANTPIASIFMAVELFGAEAGAYAGIACVISYLFSGHAGIYHAQRIGRSKHSLLTAEEGLSLAGVARSRVPPQHDLLDRLNQFGFLGESDMNHVGVLRMYFSISEMRRADSWWKRMVPQKLGEFLLQQAKDHGIEQAILHRVIGGYLKEQQLVLDTGEIPPARLPLCLELVGDEEDLQSFIHHNREHLTRVRILFLHGREAELEATLDRKELEQTLQIERDDTASE